ncbi:MAG: hypothetical protein K8S54_00860 [Spirochaetia bacterium]|nr:hypothetical protein [Spirochaetia bacterium]
MEGLQAILKTSVSVLLTTIALLCSGWLGYAKFSHDWQQFQHCPNRDVLSWDANLRMIQTLDVRSDFLNGHVLSGLGSWFESPTWPPLHSIIAQVVFIFTGPGTIPEAGIGFAFAILSILTLFAVAFSLARAENFPIWTGPALAFCCTVMLFHSPELTAYFLSAMLETQGMFFFLLTSFAFYRLRSSGLKARWWVLAGTLGLFLTKYPYGHILIVAGAPVLLLNDAARLPDLIRYLRTQYSGKALIVPGVVLGSVLLLAFAKFLPGGLLNSKTFKYVFYALVVILFLDFNWKLWRSGESVTWPDSWRVGYLYCALPILFLTFLNPDRFSSTIGTQLHQQDSSRSYFLSIFTNFTDLSAPLLVWLAVLIVLSIVFIARNRNSILDVIRQPVHLTLLLIVAHIAVLEFLTANKQLRHIYHMLPALILFWGFSMLCLARQWRMGPGLLTMGLLLASLPLLFGEKSFLGPHYYASRYVCWTGTERSLFEPVRTLVSRVDKTHSFVLINRLHDADAPVPGLQWASEFDLLLRLQSSGLIRNDSRRKKPDWSRFDGALLIQGKCPDAQGDVLVQNRAETAGEILRVENVHSGDGLCIKDFRFSRNGERQ